MYLHANAKLGLAGRFALVKAIEEGMSLKAAAAAFQRRRRNTGWGPRLVAAATGFAHSTVWKVLCRAGPPRAAKEPANRYEWPCPGDLLHVDVSRFARFLRPGHAVTGDRSQRSRNWPYANAPEHDDQSAGLGGRSERINERC
jgi:hypothetical protein